MGAAKKEWVYTVINWKWQKRVFKDNTLEAQDKQIGEEEKREGEKERVREKKRDLLTPSKGMKKKKHHD